jgi:hypothetical protein
LTIHIVSTSPSATSSLCFSPTNNSAASSRSPPPRPLTYQPPTPSLSPSPMRPGTRGCTPPSSFSALWSEKTRGKARRGEAASRLRWLSLCA